VTELYWKSGDLLHEGAGTKPPDRGQVLELKKEVISYVGLHSSNNEVLQLKSDVKLSLISSPSLCQQ